VATDSEQLAFDVVGIDDPPSQQRDGVTSDARRSTCPASETADIGSLATLAAAISKAEPGIPTARLLMQLAAVVEEAIAVSIADAYAEHQSWRTLSSMLDVPFQTLHRRFKQR
jgi:hypothetical protein